MLAGTRKDRFVLGSDGRAARTLAGPLVAGSAVSRALLDPRYGVLDARTNHAVYRPAVHRSDDGGESWKAVDGNTVRLVRAIAGG